MRDVASSLEYNAGYAAGHAAALNGLVVAPLDWKEDQGVWSAGDPWVYWIVRSAESGRFVWCETLGIEDLVPISPGRGTYDSLDEAKAVAQADFDARIRMAIVGGTMSMAMVGFDSTAVLRVLEPFADFLATGVDGADDAVMIGNEVRGIRAGDIHAAASMFSLLRGNAGRYLTLPERIARVAEAIERAEFGYRIELTRLVDGESTYTLTCDGHSPQNFPSHEDAFEVLSARRREVHARAVLAAMGDRREVEDRSSGSGGD